MAAIATEVGKGLGVVCVRVSLFTSQIVITLYMSVCVRELYDRLLKGRMSCVSNGRVHLSGNAVGDTTHTCVCMYRTTIRSSIAHDWQLSIGFCFCTCSTVFCVLFVNSVLFLHEFCKQQQLLNCGIKVV